MLSLQPVKAESLSTQVAEKIRQAIFRGELKPGETLRELVLARSMEVSQATVREALSTLETYGLVVRTPNRSTAVTSLSPSDVRDRLAVRFALESVAFRDAANAFSEQDWIEVSAVADQLCEALKGDDVLQVWKAERSFCRRVWQSCNNPLLARVLDQITTPLYALWPERPMVKPESVQALLSVLRSGDRTNLENALAVFIGITAGKAEAAGTPE